MLHGKFDGHMSHGILIVTILFLSTQPRHLDTKILQVSFLVSNFVGPKISNIAQKFHKK